MSCPLRRGRPYAVEGRRSRFDGAMLQPVDSVLFMIPPLNDEAVSLAANVTLAVVVLSGAATVKIVELGPPLSWIIFAGILVVLGLCIAVCFRTPTRPWIKWTVTVCALAHLASTGTILAYGWGSETRSTLHTVVFACALLALFCASHILDRDLRNLEELA